MVFVFLTSPSVIIRSICVAANSIISFFFMVSYMPYIYIYTHTLGLYWASLIA